MIAAVEITEEFRAEFVRIFAKKIAEIVDAERFTMLLPIKIVLINLS